MAWRYTSPEGVRDDETQAVWGIVPALYKAVP